MKTNLNEMMCLDIFVNSLSPDKYNKIKPSLNNLNNTIKGLFSADIYLHYFNSLLNNVGKNNDIIALEKLSKSFHWENNINTILKENVFESLVVTDISKKILWVNDGFTKMTGYSKKFAINKVPTFLQGKKTLQKTRKTIKRKLNTKKPFKEVILNYKKDNTPYKCELYIFPLYNHNNNVTHYLALEKQVA